MEISRVRKADLEDILRIQISAFRGETDQNYGGMMIPRSRTRSKT